MKKGFFLISFMAFILLLPILTSAQAPNLLWVKHWGSSSLDAGTSVAVDSEGNVYTTGLFRQTVDFDPGSGIFEMTASAEDIFISKLDVNGNFLWARQFTGAWNCLPNSIAVDQNGNIYTTGFFSGTIDFAPNSGSFNLTCIGAYNAFISKLDADGNFLWAKQLGGGTGGGRCIGNSVVVGQAEIYITGNFDDVIDFDLGTEVFNLTSTGSYDAFLLKLDVNGNFIWAKKIGGTGIDTGSSIVLDSDESIYTLGYFSGTVDFDLGVGEYNLTSNGDLDVFILKLDNNGGFVWAKQIGGTFDDVGNSIVIDELDNIYITGDFKGTVDFDPGAGTMNMTTINQAGNEDVFILKLNSNGNFLWVKQLGVSNAVDNSTNISGSSIMDISGNLYTMGYFAGIVDFDPSSTGVFEMISSGANNVQGIDLYFLKLDPNGNFVWGTQIGNQYSTFSAEVGDFKIDNNGNIHITGSFAGTVDFDPENTVHNLTSADYDSSYHSPYYDAFILKLGQTGTIGVKEVGKVVNPISVFPNPTDNNFIIISEQNLSGAVVTVFNVQGKIELIEAISENHQSFSLKNKSSGIYFIEIRLPNGEKMVEKIVRK